MSANGWVALLRGINVGGKNRVPMAELRRVFEDAGATGIVTYIQSGNVVFAHASGDRAVLRELLEAAVLDAFGVKSAIVLRTFGELAKVARAKPFGPDNSSTHVIFLAQKPAAEAVRSVASLDMAPDEIKVVGSEAFLHYPNGVSGARIAGRVLGQSLGVGTARNWRTVNQLAAMASAASL